MRALEVVMNVLAQLIEAGQPLAVTGAEGMWGTLLPVGGAIIALGAIAVIVGRIRAGRSLESEADADVADGK